jgi:ribosome biogenesis GTPase A
LTFSLTNYYIPLSGRNKQFRHTIIGNKPYSLVLNKADLADLKHKDLILKKLDQMNYKSTYFTQSKNTGDKNLKMILPSLIEQIKLQSRYNRDLVILKKYFYLKIFF